MLSRRTLTDQDLRNAERLEDDEFHYFRSFWASIQERGPHAGLSDREEALFRLHVGTASATYLLGKLLG